MAKQPLRIFSFLMLFVITIPNMRSASADDAPAADPKPQLVVDRNACLDLYQTAVAHKRDRLERIQKIQAWYAGEQKNRDTHAEPHEKFARQLLSDFHSNWSRESQAQSAKMLQALRTAKTWERAHPTLQGGTYDNRLRAAVAKEMRLLRPLVERDFQKSIERVAHLASADIEATELKLDPNIYSGYFLDWGDARASQSFAFTMPLELTNTAGERAVEETRFRVSLNMRSGQNWVADYQRKGTTWHTDHGPRLDFELNLANTSFKSVPPQEIRESMDLIRKDASLLPSDYERRFRGLYIGMIQRLTQKDIFAFTDIAGSIHSYNDWNTSVEYFHSDFSWAEISRQLERLSNSYYFLLFMPNASCVSELLKNPPQGEKHETYMGLVSVSAPVELK